MGNKPSVEAAPPASEGPSDQHPSPSCPVPEAYRGKAVYNVYNQRIDGAAVAGNVAVLPPGYGLMDPKNNMPLEPNQQPSAGQRKLLSTDRVHSTIPKGGTRATWVYPSPQMFYNGERGRPPVFRSRGVIAGRLCYKDS